MFSEPLHFLGRNGVVRASRCLLLFGDVLEEPSGKVEQDHRSEITETLGKEMKRTGYSKFLKASLLLCYSLCLSLTLADTWPCSQWGWGIGCAQLELFVNLLIVMAPY